MELGSNLAPQTLSRIVESVDSLRGDLIDATATVVKIPSINPTYPGQVYEDTVGGEEEAAEFVAALYGDLGCETDVFGEREGRKNAVGVLRGAGGGRSLIYNGHIDVVPPGPAEQWSEGDPWSGRVEDGAIFGRGSCDMKGGVVAQAFGIRALLEAGVTPRGDIILEAVVGEEMMEHELGTSACLERGYRADAAVVAEPTAPPAPLAVVPITPGIMSFTLSVKGKATHAALRGETISAGGYGASAGVSAIDAIMTPYQALRALETEWGRTKHHRHFRPGHFAIYPGVFVGGPSSGLVPFFIADTARIEYVVIYHPEESADDVRAEIEHQVRASAELDGWLRLHPPRIVRNPQWPQSVVPDQRPTVGATCAAHEAATGSAAMLNGFMAVNDTTFLNAAGVPAISYGPGDLRVAHAVDEHVSIDELLRAAKTYAVLAAIWCGTTS